jgi:hypothetical protein
MTIVACMYLKNFICIVLNRFLAVYRTPRFDGVDIRKPGVSA